LSVAADGSFVTTMRIRQCNLVYFTTDGVLTCQREPHHDDLCAAIDASGGELRIHPEDFARRALAQAPEIEVDGTDGSVVLRVKLPAAPTE
jgi:hypothetical protein